MMSEAATLQDIGAHGERLGEIGLLAQRLVERGDRLFASSLAPEGAAGAVERKRIDGRCGSFSGPGNWHRRRMLAAKACARPLRLWWAPEALFNAARDCGSGRR